jgi:[lysine-biosynthesis-protein LysW]--L-2-aminoadipate ligase
VQSGSVRVAIVTHHATETNLELAAWWPATLLTPADAVQVLRADDVALARLDVLPSLEGVEEGLSALVALARRGVHVLNPPTAVLAAHDKLLTARALRAAGLPHPWTRRIHPGEPPPELDLPVVVKPRFGRRGEDVSLCRTPEELDSALERLSFRPWFRTDGALAQELVPRLGRELRVLVAGRRVVGAVTRVDAEPVVAPPAACRLACAAADAVGTDLAAVDLLPTGPGCFCVLELDVAAELHSVDVAEAVGALAPRSLPSVA